MFSMKFSTTNLKRVNWQKSKRLINGSLVLLTPNNFSNIYFATVACRDERQLSQGIVGIIWEGDRPSSYANNFLMIECEVYFESYRYSNYIWATLNKDTSWFRVFVLDTGMS